MPTSWPLALDTIYGGAVVFAEEVGRLTGDDPRRLAILLPRR